MNRRRPGPPVPGGGPAGAGVDEFGLSDPGFSDYGLSDPGLTNNDPIEIENDEALGRRQAVSTDDEPVAVVFEQLADSGFVLTNKADDGNFIANQLYFGNSYALPSITGYDLLIYNDPDSGIADVKVSLWDGDPLGVADAGCNGSPAPIPGTTATFSDLPPALDVCPSFSRTGEPWCAGLIRLTVCPES